MGLIPRRRHSHQGFTLVEVLISIVVLSFGLLGMVGLQAMALQANRDARLQSVATGLARELGELMRGNAEVAAKTVVADNPYLVDDLQSPLTPTTAAYCFKPGSSCTTVKNIADAQMTEWLARVDAELPGARVTVCLDSAPFDSSGLPQWACTASAGGGDTAMVKIGWTRNPMNRGAGRGPQRATDSGATPGVIVPVSLMPVTTP